jgi:hypothetical protein
MDLLIFEYFLTERSAKPQNAGRKEGLCSKNSVHIFYQLRIFGVQHSSSLFHAQRDPSELVLAFSVRSL